MATRTIHKTPDTMSTEKQNVENPKTDRAVNARKSVIYPTPQKGKTTSVLVHPTSRIASGVKFGEKAGPVGRNSYVGEESVILGAVFAQVCLGREVNIDTGVRLGTKAEAESLGHIAVEDQANVRARTRIWSPAAGHTTTVGARAVIGEASIIGQAPTSKGHGSNKRIAIGDGITIREDVTLARRTIVGPGALIGAGVIIDAGYEIAENVEIPEGIHIEEHPLHAKNPAMRQTITPEWIDQNRSLVAQI